jgi:hypothetical protein
MYGINRKYKYPMLAPCRSCLAAFSPAARRVLANGIASAVFPYPLQPAAVLGHLWLAMLKRHRRPSS